MKTKNGHGIARIPDLKWNEKKRREVYLAVAVAAASAAAAAVLAGRTMVVAAQVEKVGGQAQPAAQGPVALPASFTWEHGRHNVSFVFSCHPLTLMTLKQRVTTAI